MKGHCSCCFHLAMLILSSVGPLKAHSEVIDGDPRSPSVSAPVIITSPQNTSKIVLEKAVFNCEWEAKPRNATIVWYRANTPLKLSSSLRSRTEMFENGTMIVHNLHRNDSGFYGCVVLNDAGVAQSAVAYLNVEFVARVTHSPDIQYLPRGHPGIIECHFEANPPFEFVMWTRNDRLFEVDFDDSTTTLKNGSLAIKRVDKTQHEGIYTCTPYNSHGTTGSSKPMKVIVKEPPVFVRAPVPLYQLELGKSLEVPCEAVEPNNGSSSTAAPPPVVTWERMTGSKGQGKLLPFGNRTRVINGTLYLENVQESDSGIYGCSARNDWTRVISHTMLLLVGSGSSAPYVSLDEDEPSGVPILTCLPEYSKEVGVKQNYVVFGRESEQSMWKEMDNRQIGYQRLVVPNLSLETSYEFMVVLTNELGQVFPSRSVNYTKENVIIRSKTPSAKTSLQPKSSTPSRDKMRLRCGGILTGRICNDPIPLEYKTNEHLLPNERCVWTVKGRGASSFKVEVLSLGYEGEEEANLILTGLEPYEPKNHFRVLNELGAVEMRGSVLIITFQTGESYPPQNSSARGFSLLITPGFEGLWSETASDESKHYIIDPSTTAAGGLKHPPTYDTGFPKADLSTFIFVPSNNLFTKGEQMNIVFVNVGISSKASECSNFLQVFRLNISSTLTPKWGEWGSLCNSNQVEVISHSDVIMIVFRRSSLDNFLESDYVGFSLAYSMSGCH